MSKSVQSDVYVEIEDYINQLWSLDGTVSRSISPATRMKLYTLIYNYIMDPPKQNMPHWSWRDKAGAHLYHHIGSFFQEKVKNAYENVNSTADKDVLQLYVVYWNNYKTTCDLVSGPYHFLDRDWVRAQFNSGRRDIYEVKLLCQLIWERIFFKPLFPRITRICLRLIKMHLNDHSSVDVQSIKNILQLYTDKIFIEIIKTDPEFESIDDIYTKCFEIEFLQEAENFYQQQEIPSFEPTRMLEYLTSIAKYFDIQIDHAKSYLPEQRSTLKKLIDILEKIFISDDTQNIILEEIKPLVWNQEKYEELTRLYEPISRIPKIKNQLIILIENYTYQMGIDTIQLVSGTAINDSKVYIETILDVYKKCLTLLQDVFNGEQCFTIILDKACVRFINDNTVTQTAGTTTKSPELLARYCDALLRKGNKAVEQTDLEEKLNQIVIVFNYIEDKDIFLKFYQKLLAKRLIGQLSASDDYEELMISKLKQTCGVEYTSKLERMFQDIAVSKTSMNEYEKHCENRHISGLVDFSVMVLTSNSWPFSPPPNFVLPIDLKPTFDSFTKFYTHRHNGRKLIWLHQHSKGELQTLFSSRKYTLQVSIYQIVVLLLFNKSLSWTVEQIQDETQIKSELLIQILCSLLQSKILLCTEINEDSKEIDIRMNYTIKLANDFKSEKLRINVNAPYKSVEQKSIADLNKTIDEERKMIIQAAIVRIMKAQQILKHSLLMQQVIQQLSSRFKPNIAVIKKCIDILIEKEYLERQSDEKDILRYLA